VAGGGPGGPKPGGGWRGDGALLDPGNLPRVRGDGWWGEFGGLPAKGQGETSTRVGSKGTPPGPGMGGGGGGRPGAALTQKWDFPHCKLVDFHGRFFISGFPK